MKSVGETLVEHGLVTREQVNRALERQRLYGGRLGDNLIHLGFLTEDQLVSNLQTIPERPRSVEETGLSTALLDDLILKHALAMGDFSVSQLRDRMCLPNAVLLDRIHDLRERHLLAVRSGGLVSELSNRIALTEAGKRRAEEAAASSRYLGPAPVNFSAYLEMVEWQSIRSMRVSEEDLVEAFRHLVIPNELLDNLGPAVSSGRTIFVYGPSGNGKTVIAQAIGNLLPGEVYLPYAVEVDGEIIQLFDELVHRLVQIARRRHREQNGRVRTYDVNLLSEKSLQGIKAGGGEGG